MILSSISLSTFNASCNTSFIKVTNILQKIYNWRMIQFPEPRGERGKGLPHKKDLDANQNFEKNPKEIPKSCLWVWLEFFSPLGGANSKTPGYLIECLVIEHYTPHAWSQGKQLVLFSRESRENKTN